jgi:predicted RNA-binding Zn-ribbon protein involved in translation (DUF1610 family)
VVIRLAGKASAWQVELACPQCGAPVVLAETDRILSCGYCKVRLGISYSDHFRYFLEPDGVDANSKEIIYVPYWRFKGIAYSCRGNTVEHRFVDSSLLAVKAAFAPNSLGFRPQALKLRLASHATPGKFLKPALPLKKLISRVIEYTNNPDGSEDPLPVYHHAFVGETTSLIYSPFYIENGSAYDAVLNKLPALAPSSHFDDSLAFDECPAWQIKFNPMMCPHCGWDLMGEADAQVLLCRNCSSGWESSNDGLKRINTTAIQSKEPDALYLPFWRIRAQIVGLQLNTYADLARLCNLPRAIKKEWNERDLYFWLPAFKTPPQLILRLTRLISVYQPSDGELSENLPNASLFPATLPKSQAALGLKAAIASMGVPKRTIFPRLPEISIKVNEYILVYIPFDTSGGELINHTMQIGISKATLQFGRLI